MAKTRPSQRTRDYIKKNFPDVFIDTVERWIPAPTLPGGGVRKDLFGIIDLIAIREGKIVGIQCSGYTAIKKHVDKLEDKPETMAWLQAGGLLEVWGFKKTRIGKQTRYLPKIVPIEIPLIQITVDASTSAAGIAKAISEKLDQDEKPKPVTELF